MKYFIFKILLLIVGSISLSVCVALLSYNDPYMLSSGLLFVMGSFLFIVLIPLFTIIISIIHVLRHQYNLKFILFLLLSAVSISIFILLFKSSNQFVGFRWFFLPMSIKVAIVPPLIVLSGLLFVMGLLLFIVLMLLFAIIVSRIHVLRHKYDLKFILFLFLSAVSIFIFILPFIFSESFVGLRWLFPPMAIMVAIAASLIVSKENTLSNVYSYILIVLFTIISPYFSSEVCPYIYSPPALTSDLLNASTDCIKFLVNHTNYKDLRVGAGCGIRINDKSYGIGINGKMALPVEESSPYSEEEVGEIIIRFRNKLYSAGVLEFRKIDDFILFYKNTNMIFPKGPGLLYSVNGLNPNEIDNEVMNSAKPFEKIIDNWYMSRRLARGGAWCDIDTVVPKALIDHSKVIANVPVEELNRFDNWQKQEDSNSVPNL